MDEILPGIVLFLFGQSPSTKQHPTRHSSSGNHRVRSKSFSSCSRILFVAQLVHPVICI